MRCFLFLCFFLAVNFSLFSQSEQLARHFFDQGEYNKALKTYEKLAAENPKNPAFFYGMVSSYQQMENYEKAEELLREKLENSANNPEILIEIGHNYELQKETARAEDFYTEALHAIGGRPNFAYSIARAFEKYSLLDFAAKAYEKGMELNNDRNFNLQLARIYGEQGKTEEMLKNYLDLIDRDPKFFNVINREFGRYITENPENEANQVFRKLLIIKLQNNPSVIYNEMLSWLFVQQKEFDKALAQEKAIYRRGEKGLQSIFSLGIMAKEAGDTEAAREIVEYVIKETPSESLVLEGRQFLLEIKTENATPAEYPVIKKEFEELLEENGYGENSLPLQVDYANFMAFKQEKKPEAINLLKELSEQTRSNFNKATVKMALADILVLQEKFNEALIYYSQVQNLVKNDEMAQEARFKVAQTSYYKGDFKWAKTQLDVLKSSTSQLIANDAMELSLLIEDNILEDSTHTALKKFAKSDLLAFQEKNQQAIELLNNILSEHKGEKIEDEALLKQALLFEKEEEFTRAEANYLNIIKNYPKDILADNAHYFLAELYANELQDPDKAKKYYEQIIFNFADSIYFVDAQKQYRFLRGDAIE